MMKKIRLIRTMVMEYEPNPEHYPKGASLEEMAKMDMSADDRELLFEGNLISDELRCEVIGESE